METVQPIPDSAPQPSTDPAAPHHQAPRARAVVSAKPRVPEADPLVGRIARAFAPLRWPVFVYLATRALVFAVALVQGALRGNAFLPQLAHWDGAWYLRLASTGYPTHVSHVLHATSTLGFFPLYPLVLWPLAHALQWATPASSLQALTISGLIVSGIGGLIATLLVQRLAESWWGAAAGRRAVVLFCLFPGSVVFSMVYAEGLALPLAAGCIVALGRRRWLLAGTLAGAATATTPEAVVLVLVCAVSALAELRRHGWRARRSLLAPLLSSTGIGAFAAYLWAHAGTPFAYTETQHYGWGEKFDPLAVIHMARSLANEISFSHFDHPTINLNLVVGVLGTIALIILVVLLLMRRREVSLEALTWTLGVSFLGLTSEFTPPNPRILITAFPALIALAYYVKGRPFVLLAATSGVLLAGLSALTFVGSTLRP